MKSTVKWIIIAWMVTGAMSTANADIVDRIVAVVNSEVITLSDLNAVFEPYMERINQQFKGRDQDKTKVIAEGKSTILKRMVDNKLIEQQSKKSGLTVKDDEVMTAIRDMLTQRNIELSEFVNGLAKEGTSFEAYKQDVKGHLLRQRLMRREVQSKIIVTDEEVGEYYKAHRDDYEGKEAVRIRQIFLHIPRGGNEQAREEVRKKAEGIRKRLLGREPFEMLAAQFSHGPEAQSGGDIGFIERGRILPEVEAAAFQLDVGAISDVIESPLGLHIIQVVDKKGAGLKPYDDVRREIQMKIEDQKMQERYERWIADLRKKSHIEMKL